MMKKAYIFLIFSIVLCAFAGGMLAGMGFTKYDIHTYAGTVVELSLIHISEPTRPY